MSPAPAIASSVGETGWLRHPARAQHIGFGSILGTDGKMLRSRAGASVKLVELLGEAVSRAGAVVAEKNPGLDETIRDEVAWAVGMGAVKYADVSTDRTKDYVFDLDRMLSFDGNTAPYLQYAHARVRSIFRRTGIDPPAAGESILVGEPAERALAIELLAFDPTVSEVAQTLDFHRLAGYLHELASRFTTFSEHCPVLRAEAPVREARLVLCDLTARTLKLGLSLLGISAPDRM
jgi:arginyl-tRNA synthetase